MKGVYPVILTQDEGVILVEVPDLEIMTEAVNLAEAMENARDAIGLKGISLEDDEQEIVKPSSVDEIDLSKSVFSGVGKQIVSLVDIDFTEYRRKNDNRSVRRNVTLPNWLNKEAEKAHINVSRVLQDALVERLNLVK